MLAIWVRAGGLARCSTRQRGIEVIFRLLQHKERQRLRRLKQCLGLVRCVVRRHVIPGKETGLKLSDPVVTFLKGKGSASRRAILKRALSEATIVEIAEF